jgi:hypothetical protein
MKLYLFALPLFTNGGGDYDEAHELWRRKALDLAGGFTELPDAHGFWMDGNKLYNDRIRHYHVACEPEVYAALLGEAFKLFPDQVSIFTAELGTAEIITRQEWNVAINDAATIVGLGEIDGVPVHCEAEAWHDFFDHLEGRPGAHE